MLNLDSLVLTIVKIVLLVLLGAYSVFSFVVMGKVRYLSQILKTEVTSPILLMVMVNLLLSLGLFFVALVVL